MQLSRYYIIIVATFSILLCQPNRPTVTGETIPGYNLIKVVPSGNDTMLIYQKGTKIIDTNKATDYINQMLYPGFLFDNGPSETEPYDQIEIDAKTAKGYFVPIDTTLYKIIDTKYTNVKLLTIYKDTLYFTDDFFGESKSLILYALKSGQYKIITLPESGIKPIYPERNQIYLLQDRKICLYTIRPLKKIKEWPEVSIKCLSLTTKGEVYITQTGEYYDNPITYSLSHPNIKMPGMLVSRYIKPDKCYLFNGEDLTDWSINQVDFSTLSSKKVIYPVQNEYAFVMNDSLFLVRNFTYHYFINNPVITPVVGNGICATYLIYIWHGDFKYPVQCNLSEVVPGLESVNTAVYDNQSNNIYIGSGLGRIYVLNINKLFPYRWNSDFNITF